MTSRSPSSPSEGEIVESDSEKRTTPFCVSIAFAGAISKTSQVTQSITFPISRASWYEAHTFRFACP
ncbi:MAG: hypothetical protein FRX48_00915 [Lasallia pustulata]|uniref:Uncharacterized protein n=1 Tax=Lasallia pustulata TaxID=136370 RepID=A0A5M8Q4Q9_9LECA|nr:MAG: hypothetical protein FRX48_00915 [Lasallia pustulata]